MTVKELYEVLGEIIDNGQGHFDVMIKVGKDGRDLIKEVAYIEDFGKNSGILCLRSQNQIGWIAKR